MNKHNQHILCPTGEHGNFLRRKDKKGHILTSRKFINSTDKSKKAFNCYHYTSFYKVRWIGDDRKPGRMKFRTQTPKQC